METEVERLLADLEHVARRIERTKDEDARDELERRLDALQADLIALEPMAGRRLVG